MGNINAPTADDRVEKVKEKLHLTDEEVNEFYAVFRSQDRQRSGYITPEAYFRGILKEELNVFGEAIFELVDTESRDMFEFGEFLEATCTFCSFDQQTILKFCFYIFDREKTGYIEMEDLRHFIRTMHKGDLLTNIDSALASFDTDGDGRFDFHEFEVLNFMYPMILYPAYRMQEQMRFHLIGDPFWTRKLAMLESAKKQEDRRRELAAEGDEDGVEDRLQAEEYLKSKMGWQYYVCPCRRGIYQARMAKVADINSAIGAPVDVEDFDDFDPENDVESSDSEDEDGDEDDDSDDEEGEAKKDKTKTGGEGDDNDKNDEQDEDDEDDDDDDEEEEDEGDGDAKQEDGEEKGEDDDAKDAADATDKGGKAEEKGDGDGDTEQKEDGEADGAEEEKGDRESKEGAADKEGEDEGKLGVADAGDTEKNAAEKEAGDNTEDTTAEATEEGDGAEEGKSDADAGEAETKVDDDDADAEKGGEAEDGDDAEGGDEAETEPGPEPEPDVDAEASEDEEEEKG